MKTLIIILCVLTIMTMAHGFNPTRYYKFHMNLCSCEKDWYTIMQDRDVTPSASNLFNCATFKDGNVHNDYGQYVLDSTKKFLEDVIENENSVEKAKEIFDDCYRRSYEDDVDITAYISKCAGNILSLIEKPRTRKELKFS